jgi:hypothetical protein
MFSVTIISLLVRIDDKLHRSVVDYPILVLAAPSVVRRHSASCLQEEGLRTLENVCLVHECHLATAVREGVLEGEAGNALGPETGDDHHRLGRRLRILFHADKVLDANLEALGILTNYHDVYVRVATALDQGLRRPHVRVEIEHLAQRDVIERKPSPTGVESGPFSATLLAQVESNVSSGKGP